MRHILIAAVSVLSLTSCANDIAYSPVTDTGSEAYPSYPNNALRGVEARIPGASDGGSEAYQTYQGVPTMVVMGGMDRTHLVSTGGDLHRDPENGSPPGFNKGSPANAGQESLALLAAWRSAKVARQAAMRNAEVARQAAMRNAEVTRQAHADPTDPTPIQR
jgi:hypothetical protein